MVRTGCYIVHRGVVDVPSVPDLPFRRRDTLTNYAGFQQYAVLDVLNIDCIVNSRGHVILLHKIAEAADDEVAWQKYNTDVEFYERSYADCLTAFRELTQTDIIDFEDTFYAVIGSRQEEISWNVVRIPADAGGGHGASVFVEALFAYGICRTAERLLGSLLAENTTRGSTERLIGHAQDLAFIERPQHFLVAKPEIALMSKFYREWNIDDDIRRLQSRFSQVIDTFNLRFNQIQAQRGMSLNRIAAGVAVIALISVSDSLAKILPWVRVDLLQKIFAVTGFGLLLWALAPDIGRLTWMATSFKRSRCLKARIRIFLREKR